MGPKNKQEKGIMTPAAIILCSVHHTFTLKTKYRRELRLQGFMTTQTLVIQDLPPLSKAFKVKNVLRARLNIALYALSAHPKLPSETF